MLRVVKQARLFVLLLVNIPVIPFSGIRWTFWLDCLRYSLRASRLRSSVLEKASPEHIVLLLEQLRNPMLIKIDHQSEQISEVKNVDDLENHDKEIVNRSVLKKERQMFNHLIKATVKAEGKGDSLKFLSIGLAEAALAVCEVSDFDEPKTIYGKSFLSMNERGIFPLLDRIADKLEVLLMTGLIVEEDVLNTAADPQSFINIFKHLFNKHEGTYMKAVLSDENEVALQISTHQKI